MGDAHARPEMRLTVSNAIQLTKDSLTGSAVERFLRAQLPQLWKNVHTKRTEFPPPEKIWNITEPKRTSQRGDFRKFLVADKRDPAGMASGLAPKVQ